MLCLEQKHGMDGASPCVWFARLNYAKKIPWTCTESRSYRFRKWRYSGVTLVSIWTDGHEYGWVLNSRLQVVCLCIMNWRRHFGPCCGLHSLACTLIFKLLLCPIDRYDVYLYGHQCQKHLNKSWVFMWTCYSWSCNAWRTCRIEIGETTWSF